VDFALSVLLRRKHHRMMTAPLVLDSADAIRDHLVLGVPPWDRHVRTVRFVLCDHENRVLAHCPVSLTKADVDATEAAGMVDLFAAALENGAGAGKRPGLLVVLTRPGDADFTDADRQWFRVAHRVCGRHHVRLLGVHLLTGKQHRELSQDDAA
jgi:hypothetical protein